MEANGPTSTGDPAIETLKASWRKWLGVGAIGLVFSVVSVAMIRDERWAGWLVLLFGVACGLIGVWQLVSPSRLVIRSSTVEAVGPGRNHQIYDLRRCGEFRVWRIPRGWNRFVVFDYEGNEPHSMLERTNRRLTDATASLPDTYGMSAQSLADLLNRHRLHAIATAGA